MKQINHYKIIKKLGTGGMGEVYKAFDTMLERDVAVKVMHEHLLDDKTNEKRFLSEARAAAKLVHPNIVTIHEIGSADVGRYIAMEYVEGISLADLLRSENKLSPHRAIQIIIGVLQGIAAAHQFGILHRDIKADNILMTTDDAAKILDFGIAKIQTSSESVMESDASGTIEYMPPEQMLGDTTDKTCDLYATGLMFYQILTNKFPFVADTPVEILFKKLNEEPVFPSYLNEDVSQDLDHVILKALNPTQQERWQTADDFIRAIKSCADDVSITAGITDLKVEPEGKIVSPGTLHPVFIGRDNELRTLINYFRLSTRKEGQTVLLKGEAGVGKSSLAKQVVDFAEKFDSFVLSGECLYRKGFDAFLPFIDIVRKFFKRDIYRFPEYERDKLVDEIKNKTHYLLEFTDQFSKAAASDKGEQPGAKKGNLLEDMYFFISHLATIQPVLLILDDIQWADESSMQLLHYLARSIKHQRVCILAISRTDRYDLQKDGKPTKVIDVLARMHREGVYKEIILDRLNREDCEQLVDLSLAKTLFTEEFYESIHKETNGNPLFILETLKALQESKSIYVQNGSWYDKQDDFILEVPHRVEDIFVRRLSALSDDEKDILQVAAILGYRFDVSLLSKLLEISRIKLLKILQRVENDLQIVISTETGYQFEHPMLEDMLVDQVPQLLRKEYHLMAAYELEKIYGDNLDNQVGEVAQHFRKGANHKKAVPLLYQAAINAFGISSFRSASIFFEDLIDSSEMSGEPFTNIISHHDLYFNLEVCYDEIGRWDQSLKILNKLLTIAEKKNHPKNQADVLARIGSTYDKLGDLDRALETFNQSLTIVQNNDISIAYCKIYNNIGVVYFEKGDYDRALEYFDKSLKTPPDESNKSYQANALTNTATIYNIQGNHTAALAKYKEAFIIHKQKNDQKGVARILHNMGMTQTDLNEWEKAIENFEQCLTVAAEIEDKHLRALTYLNMGKAYARQGDLGKAYNLVSKAIKIFERMADILSVAEAYHIYGLIYIEKNDFTKAERYLKQSMQINAQKDYQEGLAENYVYYGMLCANFEIIDRAKEYYELAIEAYSKLGSTKKVESLQKSVHDLEIEHMNQSVETGNTAKKK